MLAALALAGQSLGDSFARKSPTTFTQTIHAPHLTTHKAINMRDYRKLLLIPQG